MEMKCFESREHFESHPKPFPHILKEFEEIEKKLDFQVFQLKSQGISLNRINSNTILGPWEVDFQNFEFSSIWLNGPQFYCAVKFFLGCSRHIGILKEPTLAIFRKKKKCPPFLEKKTAWGLPFKITTFKSKCDVKMVSVTFHV